MHPTAASVKDDTIMALTEINSSLSSSVVWNQIIFTINTSTNTIKLTPIDGSNLYQTTINIVYTLKS
jgi:hypothetical protein